MKGKKTHTENKRLVLLDAHAIIHRAYHALPDFSTPGGEPSGAIYGLISMLLRIVKELKPDHIAAAYDLAGPTFRHAAYEAYKGTRAKLEEPLVHQLGRSRDVFKAFNIPVYEAPGFEADDVLGTIVEMTKKEKGLDIIIASGDMDTLQLVDGKRIRVYTLKKGINDTILYDEDGVLARFGFPPKQIPDYKGLRGDPSDNIPGVRGVGEKTAGILVQKFGTLENLYKVLKKDEASVEAAGISKRLVGVLKENEEEAFFSKTLAEIRRDAPVAFVIPDAPWKESASLKEIELFLRSFEFKSLIPRAQELFSGGGTELVVPEEDAPVSPDEKEELAIALWLIDSEKTNPDLDDVYDFAKTRDPKEAKKVLVGELARRGLTKVYEDIELPLIPILRAAKARGIGIDVSYFTKLSRDYHTELEATEKKIFELAGGEFNINSPKQLGDVLFDRLHIAVPGLRQKRTQGGARSTRAAELEKLKGAHPVIEEILRYRERQKLLSTYIDSIPPLAGDDGRLHTHLVQAGTTTGRFASVNPNLQNIPIKSELGRAIRYGFVATPGHVLISLDYSQIELRVAAVLSGDKNLTRIFQEGKDVHAAVASRVFHVAESDVTADMRRAAKVINFGIIYGMGVNALRESLGGTRAEAEEFYEAYLSEFKGLADYMERVKHDAAKHGYTETLYGRRRMFPALRSGIPYMKAMAERMAMNAPIQGTATADIIKIAIRLVDEKLRAEGLIEKAHLLLQVHDELIYEVEEKAAATAEALIKERMESVLRETAPEHATVPLLVSASHGRSWGDL